MCGEQEGPGEDNENHRVCCPCLAKPRFLALERSTQSRVSFMMTGIISARQTWPSSKHMPPSRHGSWTSERLPSRSGMVGRRLQVQSMQRLELMRGGRRRVRRLLCSFT